MMASELDEVLSNTSRALNDDERLARLGAAVITHWNEISADTRARIIRTADVLAGGQPSANEFMLRGVPEREKRLMHRINGLSGAKRRVSGVEIEVVARTFYEFDRHTNPTPWRNVDAHVRANYLNRASTALYAGDRPRSHF
jgi:hypothetical protein